RNETRIVEHDSLCGGKKKHRRDFARGLAILSVLRHSYDLEEAGVLHVDISEMMPKRTFVFEEFLREDFVHDGDTLRGRRVLVADGTALNDFGAQSFKVTGADAEPRSVVLIGVGGRRRLPFDINGFAPVVAFHRSVKSEAHLTDPRDRRDRIMKLAEQRLHLRGFVSGL